MEQETHQAIIEGVQASQQEEKLQKEKENEENDRAAAEAAKDLMPDYEQQVQEKSEDGNDATGEASSANDEQFGISKVS